MRGGSAGASGHGKRSLDPLTALAGIVAVVGVGWLLCKKRAIPLLVVLIVGFIGILSEGKVHVSGEFVGFMVIVGALSANHISKQKPK